MLVESLYQFITLIYIFHLSLHSVLSCRSFFLFFFLLLLYLLFSLYVSVSHTYNLFVSLSPSFFFSLFLSFFLSLILFGLIASLLWTIASLYLFSCDSHCIASRGIKTHWTPPLLRDYFLYDIAPLKTFWSRNQYNNP